MLIASILLGALAVILAWPVPVLLAGARWQSRSPAVALVLWQSIALAGGLSMIGALLTFGLAPFGDDLVGSVAALVTAAGGTGGVPGELQFWHLLALAGAVLLGGHLLLNLVITVLRSEAQRRRHAQLVSLLSSPMEHSPGARILDTPAPVAYCLPGPFRSITVLSAGLVSLLDAGELEAVIEHERGHLSQRHDIVLILFRAWHASLPWFPIAYGAQLQVARLVEMLADDRARRVVDDATLARAIALTGTAVPAVAESAVRQVGGPEPGTLLEVTERIRRLERLPNPLPRAANGAIIAAAVALIAVPTALLVAPALA